MPFAERGGGGGGAGGVHASIYAASDSEQGVEVQLPEDAGWALITEHRAASGDTQAFAEIDGTAAAKRD